MNNIIEANNLIFEYYNYNEDGKLESTINALNDVSLDIKEGEFLVVLGHNGSGKSTFAKHLNGILTPKQGTLIVKGIDATNSDNIWDIR